VKTHAARVKIGDIISPVSTWNPNRDGGSVTIRYIDLSSVNNKTKLIEGSQSVSAAEAPSRARQLVCNGDILVSTVRPNLNGVARVPEALDGATASTGFCVLRTGSRVDAAYLFHWVKAPAFVTEMIRLATGQSYPAVSDRIIFDSEIPLPPLDEQRRIAAILDQADDLRRKRREAMRQIDFLTLAIFEDMFGDPVANSRKWTTQQLKDLTLKIGSGSTPTGGEAAYESTGTPLIRSMNVHDGRFKHDGLAFINQLQAAKLDNVVVHAQDVLLNITGASVARVCRTPHSLHGARVNQHVAIIRPIRTLLPRFLESALLHPKAKTKLLNIGSSGATREAITKAQILQYDMIVPPLEDQLEFERRAMGAEVLADCLLKQSHLFNAAFASLQHRAFNGEL